MASRPPTGLQVPQASDGGCRFLAGPLKLANATGSKRVQTTADQAQPANRISAGTYSYRYQPESVCPHRRWSHYPVTRLEPSLLVGG
jgi:hypothetical protein